MVVILLLAVITQEAKAKPGWSGGGGGRASVAAVPGWGGAPRGVDQRDGSLAVAGPGTVAAEPRAPRRELQP